MSSTEQKQKSEKKSEPKTMQIDLNESFETFALTYLRDYLRKNALNIIQAAKIGEMPNKGGFVVLEAGENVEKTLIESFESSIEGLKFKDVFEDFQLVPNKNDGDLFDALFTFKIRGGPKEYREQIAEWKKELTTKFEKGQFKTISQYKSKRLNKKRKQSGDDGEDNDEQEGQTTKSKKKQSGTEQKKKRAKKAKKEEKEEEEQEEEEEEEEEEQEEEETKEDDDDSTE